MTTKFREGDVVQPHEERWIVLATEFGPWKIIDMRGGIVGVVGDGCSEPARAKLAAAAPEMARALIEVFNHAGDGRLKELAANALEKAGALEVTRVKVRP